MANARGRRSGKTQRRAAGDAMGASPWWSIPKAAEYVGVNPETIARALRRERKHAGSGLKGTQIGGRGNRREWRTTRKWINEWLARSANSAEARTAAAALESAAATV